MPKGFVVKADFKDKPMTLGAIYVARFPTREQAVQYCEYRSYKYDFYHIKNLDLFIEEWK